jgi:hypothetical protein
LPSPPSLAAQRLLTNDRDVAVDDFARSAGPLDDAGKRAVDLKRPTAELKPALGDIVWHRPT